MGIRETARFPIGKMLKSSLSMMFGLHVMIKIQVLSSDGTIYGYLTIPFIHCLAHTALDLFSGATSLCNRAMYCPTLVGNWSGHTEDIRNHIIHMIQAYELYFYGTESYRWKLLNSGDWQASVA